MWRAYIDQWRLRAAEQDDRADNMPPGMEEYTYNFVQGVFDDVSVLFYGDSAYSVASKENVERKRAVASYFSEVAAKKNWADVEASVVSEAIVAFAIRLQVDLDIPEDIRSNLFTSARQEIANGDRLEASQAFRRLRLARTVGYGASYKEAIDLMKGSGTMPERETLLGEVVELYTHMSNWFDAAAITSRIGAMSVWCRAVDMYTLAGGSIDTLQEAEDAWIRELTRAFPLEELDEQKITWNAHKDVITFLRSMTTGHYSRACLALQKMAEEGTVPIQNTLQYASQLLRRDAKSAATGLAVTDALCANKEVKTERVQDVYELFTAHNAPGVAAAHWQWVQGCREGRVVYFKRYAGAVLASALAGG